MLPNDPGLAEEPITDDFILSQPEVEEGKIALLPLIR